MAIHQLRGFENRHNYPTTTRISLTTLLQTFSRIKLQTNGDFFSSKNEWMDKQKEGTIIDKLKID